MKYMLMPCRNCMRWLSADGTKPRRWFVALLARVLPRRAPTADFVDTRPELLPVPIPSLAAVLLELEQAKGRALTRAEVLECRDRALCLIMRRRDLMDLESRRGYRDLRVRHVWTDWLELHSRFDRLGADTGFG